MSSDYVLTVKQIAQYPTAPPNGTLLMQQGGLGGPYVSIAAPDLVATALLFGGGPLQVGVQAPSDADPTQVFANGLLMPQAGGIGWNTYGAIDHPMGSTAMAGGQSALVIFDQAYGLRFKFGFAATAGALIDWNDVLDVSSSGHLMVADQVTLGRDPIAPLEAVTLQYVTANTVSSFNFRTGAVQLELYDVLRAGGAPVYGPSFGGHVTAPTPWDPTLNDNTVATTAWVNQAMSNFVQCQGLVLSFNGRGGCVVLTDADITLACTAPGAMPRSNTPPIGDASSRIATTLFVDGSLAEVYSHIEHTALTGYAPLNSPDFTGIPLAPTANPGTTTGQIATTAFVMGAVAASTAGVSSFNTRTGAVVLTAADLTAAGGALTASPVLTGTPAAPTAAPGTATTQIATTAFVTAAITAAGSVSSFNTRTGAVTLTAADVTASGALNNTPLTGVPTAPTAAPGTATTQLATTAFVAAIAAAGVTSFNGRSGPVTLLNADVSAAGGALVASPTFTGVPAAPTATAGTSTTQLATTAFVAAALAAGGGVISFNSRAGVVTLSAADITGAGGALAAGITNGSSAPAGAIGEYLNAGPATVTLVSGAVTMVTSLVIPAGDWEIYGWVAGNPTGGAVCSAMQAGISTSATSFTQSSTYLGVAGMNGYGAMTVPILRLNNPTPTTVYLDCAVTWVTGTMQMGGQLNARRMR